MVPLGVAFKAKQVGALNKKRHPQVARKWVNGLAWGLPAFSSTPPPKTLQKLGNCPCRLGWLWVFGAAFPDSDRFGLKAWWLSAMQFLIFLVFFVVVSVFHPLKVLAGGSEHGQPSAARRGIAQAGAGLRWGGLQGKGQRGSLPAHSRPVAFVLLQRVFMGFLLGHIFYSLASCG